MCNKKQGIHKDICEMFLGRGANVMSGKSGAAKPSTRDFLSRPAPPRALHQDHGILQWFQQMPRPHLPAAAMVATLWPGDLGSPAAKPFRRNMEDLRAMPSCAPPCDAPAPGSIAGIASMLSPQWNQCWSWCSGPNSPGTPRAACILLLCEGPASMLAITSKLPRSLIHIRSYQSYHFHFSTTLRTPTSRQSPSPGPTCNAQLCSSY